MATRMEAKVTRVVVMEDRAQVERQGELELEAGRHVLEIAGVAVVAVDKSLKVEVTGASFVDAKLKRRWREKPKGGLPADASALRKREFELSREEDVKDDAVKALVARHEVLLQARQDLLRSICETAGFGSADAATWKADLDEVDEAQRALDGQLRAARHEAAHTKKLLIEARGALAAAEEKERDLECLLEVTVEGGGKVGVRASYLVPCASWRPAYRATLKDSNVLLEAEGVVWQRTGEAWDGVSLAFSTARPTLGTTPPMLVADRLRTRPREDQEKRTVSVSFREEDIQSAGETSPSSPELPGLDDGGEARLLEAPGRASIPSDGQPHRVGLSHFEAKAEVERVCPAELTPLVSTVARFPNAGSHVLLAGPVDLVRQSGFVGRSLIKFAAPGETVRLSFGSEDGLRVDRHVEEKREEARLTGRRTTTRTIRLHVSNASPTAAKVAIEERLPVSEVKEVEVQVLSRLCKPAAPQVSKEGIARFELDLSPNGTATAVFAWELSAAAKVAGV